MGGLMRKTIFSNIKEAKKIHSPENSNAFPHQSLAKSSQLLEKLRRSGSDIFQNNNMLYAAREIAKRGSADEKNEALKIILTRGMGEIPEIIKASKETETGRDGNSIRVQLRILGPISLYLDAANEISPESCSGLVKFIDENYGKRLVEVFDMIVSKKEDFLRPSELLMVLRELNLHAPETLGVSERDFHDVCALFCKPALQKGEELNGRGKTLTSRNLAPGEHTALIEAESVRALLKGQPGSFFPVSLVISTFKSFPKIEAEVMERQRQKYGDVFPAQSKS